MWVGLAADPRALAETLEGGDVGSETLAQAFTLQQRNSAAVAVRKVISRRN
jgi:hypothetical protein